MKEIHCTRKVVAPDDPLTPADSRPQETRSRTACSRTPCSLTRNTRRRSGGFSVAFTASRGTARAVPLPSRAFGSLALRAAPLQRIGDVARRRRGQTRPCFSALGSLSLGLERSPGSIATTPARSLAWPSTAPCTRRDCTTFL
ncbi:hypothetical protein PDJAM_G00050580 [Pangasius djambal]|uniref:Uncharacterized protein n=1 Tax=Pangasius djambal TaxID=1691987 RepID=A0ACC5YXG2_9TELE|nr:hypothetical protein [Pangasius djambal]